MTSLSREKSADCHRGAAARLETWWNTKQDRQSRITDEIKDLVRIESPADD